MSERKPCVQPGCGCDYEENFDTETEHDELTYCIDPGTPIMCQIPEVKCKYPGTECPHKNYYLGDDEEENPLCQVIRSGVAGCPLKVYEPEGETWSLQETITRSPYWNLRGFKYYRGAIIVDKKIIRAIMSWAGDCTEPNSGIYKHPDAMFNALNLIYKLIDECEEGPVTVENKDVLGEGPESVKLLQIKSVGKHSKRRDE